MKRTTLRPKTLLVVALALAVALAPTSGLDAKKKRKKHKSGYQSQVVIREVTKEGLVKGIIESKEPRCVEGRKVRVERDGERVGSTAAAADGTWVATTNGNFDSGDQLIAKIDKHKLKNSQKKSKGKGKKQSDNPADPSQPKKKKQRRNRTFCESDISGPFDMNRLTVIVDGEGTVVSTPGGISCRETSGTCSALFGATTTALDAKPDPGASFVGYSGDCSGTNPHCEVEMDADRNVRGEFGAGGGGGGSCPPEIEAIPVIGPILCGLLG
jgi:hypothetical protein